MAKEQGRSSIASTKDQGRDSIASTKDKSIASITSTKEHSRASTSTATPKEQRRASGASGKIRASTAAISLKDVITCRWCKENLTLTTKLLQFDCIHHGCLACLTKTLPDLQPGTLFSCPECDLTCIIPIDGVDDIPEERLLKKMKAIAEIHANNYPECEYCEQIHQTNGSTFVCITCKMHLCKEDAQKHRAHPDHQVIVIQELQSEPYLSQMLECKADMCPKHSTEWKYFCEDCEEEICTDCVVLDHASCQMTSIEEAAAAKKEILETELKKLERAEEILKERMKRSKKKMNGIQQTLKENIENHKTEEDCLKQFTDKQIEEMIKNAKMYRDNLIQVNHMLLRKIHQLQMGQQYLKIFGKYSSKLDTIQRHQFMMDYIKNNVRQVPACQVEEMEVFPVPERAPRMSFFRWLLGRFL